jgi:hypothetical protein
MSEDGLSTNYTNEENAYGSIKNFFVALNFQIKNNMSQIFESILPLKVEGIVEQLIEQRKMPLQEALEYLYSSQLYALLEQEDTKMWHYSPQMLLHLLDEEKETGILTLPE